MNKIKIPWCVPEIGEEELNQVIDCFSSGWLTSGKKVNKFEDNLSEYLAVPHAAAVSNGTDALDLALKAIGVQSGDEVIIPAMTFIATASAISYQNAVPVFVDIEPETLNLNPEKIREAITKKTKAIIFIDYGGNPANYDDIANVGKEFGIPIIQDGAHSIGGTYKGKPMGAQAVISTISFHMAKVLTTVEGGMIFTHSKKYKDEITMRRSHGETGKVKYDHVILGTNARMTDIQAGIGLAQFRKLKYILANRRKVAKIYDNSFMDQFGKITTMRTIEPDSQMAPFLYSVLISKRDYIADKLINKYGIDTRVCWPKPIYLQPMYKSGKVTYRKYPCPVTEETCTKILNLPIYPSMPINDVKVVAKALIDEVN